MAKVLLCWVHGAGPMCASGWWNWQQPAAASASEPQAGLWWGWVHVLVVVTFCINMLRRALLADAHNWGIGAFPAVLGRLRHPPPHASCLLLYMFKLSVVDAPTQHPDCCCRAHLSLWRLGCTMCPRAWQLPQSWQQRAPHPAGRCCGQHSRHCPRHWWHHQHTCLWRRSGGRGVL